MTSVGARIEMTKVSLDLMRERPLIGWGTGAYRKHFCERVSNDEVCATGGYHPHNQFLSFGVQWGLIGILAYLAFLASAIYHSRPFSRPDKILAYGLISSLIVDSLLHAPLFLVGEAQFYILMLAVVLAKTKLNRPPSIQDQKTSLS